MCYEDFVYFILAEEDKSSEPSLEYWCVIVVPFVICIAGYVIKNAHKIIRSHTWILAPIREIL